MATLSVTTSLSSSCLVVAVLNLCTVGSTTCPLEEQSPPHKGSGTIRRDSPRCRTPPCPHRTPGCRYSTSARWDHSSTLGRSPGQVSGHPHQDLPWGKRCSPREMEWSPRTKHRYHEHESQCTLSKLERLTWPPKTGSTRAMLGVSTTSESKMLPPAITSRPRPDIPEVLGSFNLCWRTLA